MSAWPRSSRAVPVPSPLMLTLYWRQSRKEKPGLPDRTRRRGEVHKEGESGAEQGIRNRERLHYVVDGTTMP